MLLTSITIAPDSSTSAFSITIILYGKYLYKCVFIHDFSIQTNGSRKVPVEEHVEKILPKTADPSGKVVDTAQQDATAETNTSTADASQAATNSQPLLEVSIAKVHLPFRV